MVCDFVFIDLSVMSQRDVQFLWFSENCQFTFEKIHFCLCRDLVITGQYPF